jgi:hypothetical protein
MSLLGSNNSILIQITKPLDIQYSFLPPVSCRYVPPRLKQQSVY